MGTQAKGLKISGVDEGTIRIIFASKHGALVWRMPISKAPSDIARATIIETGFISLYEGWKRPFAFKRAFIDGFTAVMVSQGIKVTQLPRAIGCDFVHASWLFSPTIPMKIQGVGDTSKILAKCIAESSAERIPLIKAIGTRLIVGSISVRRFQRIIDQRGDASEALKLVA